MTRPVGVLRWLVIAPAAMLLILATLSSNVPRTISAFVPETIVVTTVADYGPGSLRQAILDVADGGHIVFAPNVSRTLTLSSELLITRSLSIDGPGAQALALDGGYISHVLNIDPPDTRVALSSLTIQHGWQTLPFTVGGGAILNYGRLRMQDVAIMNNSSGTSGGGLENFGTATLLNVLFRGNSSSGYAAGGAIFNGYSATLTMTNVMLSENRSIVGAGLANLGSAYLVNVTLLDNQSYLGGAAIRNGDGSPLRMRNTLIGHSNIGDNCVGDLTSLGYNLSDDTSCSLTASGDLPNTDTLAARLALNGGQTATNALLPGSPAINVGDNTACPSTDQRGIPRPRAQGCDIGAYEFAFPLSLHLPAVAL